MNGVHDLGGLDGLGAVAPSEREPAFYSDWERAVFAMFLPYLTSGLNLDQFRNGIERMHPVDYLAGRYYEHWLYTIEHGLVEKGVISGPELEARTRRYRDNPDAPLPEPSSPPDVDELLSVYRTGASTRREVSRAPRFGVGDSVRVRNLNPIGHTRCARYLRGKRGVVAAAYDAFVFSDSNAREDGEDPQHVYNVRFDGGELWGDDAEDGLTIHVDLFEPYLEPVASAAQDEETAS
jgi:nitrile hydratase beta subunit